MRDLVQDTKPTIFVGNPIDGKPAPWKNGVEIDALLINAYEIYKKEKFRKKIEEAGGLHNYLKFDGKIMLDSGGFQFQKHAEINVNINKIIEIQKILKPDISVVLDFPLSPSETKIANERRQKITLRNIEHYLEEWDDCDDILPVIHGYSPENIKKFINALVDVWGYEPKKVGVGSLVPLMKGHNKLKEYYGTNGHNSSRKFIVDIVSTVREELPESFIHVFGVGASITSMYIMFTLGINSVDSVAWRLQAAGGKLALPLIGTRILKKAPNSWARPISKKEWERYNCQCIICRGSGQKLKELNDYYKRALHNIWTYMNELKMIRETINNGSFLHLAESRLRVTSYYPMFIYARDRADELGILDKFNTKL
jgi:tRNA-guanine family transglycosylase